MKYFKNDVYSCSGSPVRDLFEPIVNDDGSIDLKISGQENTDEMIQSYGESCDLNVILTRVMNGEVEPVLLTSQLELALGICIVKGVE